MYGSWDIVHDRQTDGWKKWHIEVGAQPKKWKDEFSGPVFCSHSTSNSCSVLITLFGKNKICVNSQITDKHGQILILDVTIDGSEYILVNIYNANTESEQLKILNDLSELMKKVNITHGKEIVLASDFIYFLTVI